MSKRLSIPEETVERIVAMYPTMSKREISAELGVTDYAVGFIVKRLGLKHTEETLRRFEEWRTCCLKAWAKSPEAKESFAVKAQRTRMQLKMERVRIMGGMRQETDRILWIFPKKVRRAIYGLHYRYGYLYTVNSYTLRYDAQTHRNPNEARYTEKYGLQFLPEETEEEVEETEEEQETADNSQDEQEYDDIL